MSQRPFPRVLVVDDDRDSRDSIAALIRVTVRRADVETAAGPVEALEIARRQRPQLILSDLVMAPIQGDEFLRRIRTFLPDAVLVLVTAHPSEAVRSHSA